MMTDQRRREETMTLPPSKARPCTQKAVPALSRRVPPGATLFRRESSSPLGQIYHNGKTRGFLQRGSLPGWRAYRTENLYTRVCVYFFPGSRITEGNSG